MASKSERVNENFKPKNVQLYEKLKYAGEWPI